MAALKRLFSKATFKHAYFNNEGLPHWLSPFDTLFACMGFGIGVLGHQKYLHYRSWFREKLSGYLHDIVTDVRARRSPVWNPPFFQKMTAKHIRSHRNYVLEINGVLTLEAIERLLFRDLPTGNGESGNPGIHGTVLARATP
jgi:hypothetical protein